MAQHHINAFEQTVQETYAWLNDISNEMGDPRTPIAYHALRGVMFALRDRLPTAEAVQLSAQLPLLVRGIFFDGYRVAGKPEKLNRDEFLARVADELQKAGGANVENAVRAVLAVMLSRVDPGEMEDVRTALPADLKSLWPERIPV